MGRTRNTFAATLLAVLCLSGAASAQAEEAGDTYRRSDHNRAAMMEQYRAKELQRRTRAANSRSTAAVSQQGVGHAAAVRQQGSANAATVRQFGQSHSGVVTQAGSRNTACLLQFGRGASGELTQVGDGQSLGVIQTPTATRQVSVELCSRRPAQAYLDRAAQFDATQ